MIQVQYELSPPLAFPRYQGRHSVRTTDEPVEVAIAADVHAKTGFHMRGRTPAVFGLEDHQGRYFDVQLGRRTEGGSFKVYAQLRVRFEARRMEEGDEPAGKLRSLRDVTDEELWWFARADLGDDLGQPEGSAGPFAGPRVPPVVREALQLAYRRAGRPVEEGAMLRLCKCGGPIAARLWENPADALEHSPTSGWECLNCERSVALGESWITLEPGLAMLGEDYAAIGDGPLPMLTEDARADRIL